MKISRILSVFLALVMVVGCIAAFPVSAEDDLADSVGSTSTYKIDSKGYVNIYIDGVNGSDDNDGATASTAKKTIGHTTDNITKAAIDIAVSVRDANNELEGSTMNRKIYGANIILVDNVTITCNAYAIIENAHSTLPIVYSGLNGDEYLIFDSSSRPTNNNFYRQQGKTTYTNLTIVGIGHTSTSYHLILNANGYDLTMGIEGVDAPGKVVISNGTTNSIDLGNGNVTTSRVQIERAYGAGNATVNGSTQTVTLNSGTYYNVMVAGGYEGGTIGSTANPYGAKTVINGAKVHYLCLADLHGGSKHGYIYGETVVELNSANILNFYTCRDASSTGSSVTFYDKVTVKVNSLISSYPTIKDNIADTSITNGDVTASHVNFKNGLEVDFTQFKGNSPWSYENLKDGRNDTYPLGFADLKVAEVYDNKPLFVQQSTLNADEETVNLRFVAGLREYEGKAATFSIVGKSGGNAIYNSGVVNVKSVYSSVKTDYGLNGVTAASEDVNYFMACVIKDVPIDAGELTFEVTTSIYTDGQTPTIETSYTEVFTYKYVSAS